jgi:FemAB-related protein (PEP-CTERM system-associated)
MGGILANTPDGEKCLLSHAVSTAERLHARSLQLRHATPLAALSAEEVDLPQGKRKGLFCRTATHKVRMLLDLPGSSEALWKSFKSKLRSQINRPIKEGLQAKSGGKELVGEFYRVFLENMRDLGSPVHSKGLVENVMVEFADRARIFIVHLDGSPVAASLSVGFKEVMGNPWSSALRRYQRLSPNMLLYWKMLEYAADNKFTQCDFGRSSPGEGTFKFKAQWGACPTPLYWHSIDVKRVGKASGELNKLKAAASIWKRLPICLTKIIGPPIRKHIDL